MIAWVAAVILAFSPQPGRRHLAAVSSSPRTQVTAVSRRVFGRRWRTAKCIAYYESRYTLRARNGANLGPWQINVTAHPWVNGWRLTHSWLYSARVAYRISAHGRNWSPWTTHGLCSA